MYMMGVPAIADFLTEDFAVSHNAKLIPKFFPLIKFTGVTQIHIECMYQTNEPFIQSMD